MQIFTFRRLGIRRVLQNRNKTQNSVRWSCFLFIFSTFYSWYSGHNICCSRFLFLYEIVYLIKITVIKVKFNLKRCAFSDFFYQYIIIYALRINKRYLELRWPQILNIQLTTALSIFTFFTIYLSIMLHSMQKRVRYLHATKKYCR